MKIKCSNSLIRLAQIFGHQTPLYIVGGYVRNAIMGRQDTDIDICSALTIEQVMHILDGTEYLVKIKSAKMGTVTIICGNEEYEHTTFRHEMYDDIGTHTPTSVEFVNSLEDDSRRRDFTINSIYYNITTGKIIDIFGGVADTNNKIVKCIIDGDYVFGSDGLRILRCLRFAVELGFAIENETMQSLIKNKAKLNAITGERKTSELKKMFGTVSKMSSDEINSKSVQAIRYITKFELLPNIFGQVKKLKNMKIENFIYFLSPYSNNKFNAFICDIYNYTKDKLDFTDMDFETNILGSLGLNLSRRQTKYFLQLCKALNLEPNTNLKKRLYVTQSIHMWNDLTELLKIKNAEFLNEIVLLRSEMVETHCPMDKKDLAIKAKDIIDNFDCDVKILTNLLWRLYLVCLQTPQLNSVDALIDYIKQTKMIKEEK